MTFWFLEYTVHLIIYQQGIYPAEKKLQHSLDGSSLVYSNIVDSGNSLSNPDWHNQAQMDWLIPPVIKPVSVNFF